MEIPKKIMQTLSGHILIFAQGLVLIPIILKASSTETLGLYVVLSSYLSIVHGFSSFGVGIKKKRYLPSADTNVEKANIFYPQFWFQLMSVSLISLIVVLILPYLETFFDAESMGFILPLYLLTLVFYSQTVDYFRYTHRVGIFNVVTVAQAYFFIIILVLIYWLNYDSINVSSILIYSIFSYVIVGVFCFLLIYREIGIQYVLPSKGCIKKEIKLGLPLVFSFFVDTMLSIGDRFVIASLMTLHYVGTYVPAYALGSLIMVFPKVLSVVLTPVLSQKSDKKDNVSVHKVLSGSIDIFLLISIPYVIGSLVLGENILRLYTNSEIAESSWMVIPIVALASIFYGLMTIKAIVIFVKLKTVSLLKISLISAILNILLNVILISLFNNIMMAAITTLISYIFGYFYTILILKKYEFKLIINYTWILRLLVSSIGMYIVLKLFLFINQVPDEQYGALFIFTSIFLGCASYSIFVFSNKKNRLYCMESIQFLKS
jgi:O-antigen/teichoic acid export membrane protein